MWLQRFAEERQEPATPRRREEARRRGRVFRSVELTAAMALLAAWFVLRGGLIPAATRLSAFMAERLGTLAGGELTTEGLMALARQGAVMGAVVVAPIALAAFAVGIASSVAQSGFVFSGQPLVPDFSRLSPVEGLRRIFSARALADLLKSALKLAVVGWVVWATARRRLDGLVPLASADLVYGVRAVGRLVADVVLRSGLAFLVIGVLDATYGRWEYERSLRMSRQEIREEMREVEGDPQIRARRRSALRALLRGRQLRDVARADVVITNPTHLAVALRYDAKAMAAPVVLAKGRNLMAQRIKEIARQHRVPLVANPPLCRALDRTAEVGKPIPVELYQAVAEVLAFVYRLSGRS